MKAVGDAIIDNMVHDPVAEVGRPHLSVFRPRDHKTDRSADPIGPAVQVAKERHQVALKPLLKPYGVRRIALVSPAIKIGLKNLFQRKKHPSLNLLTARTLYAFVLLLLAFWLPLLKFWFQALLELLSVEDQ
jgi:hypothetical protein